MVATGAGTLTYQWRKNGSNITSGGNASTLTIAAASFADADNYDVRVTDDTGTTQSDPVTLTVISRAPNASITPSSPVVNPSSPVIFSANVATGIAPFTYQWRKNGAKLTGATASTYSIPSAQQSHEGNYDCVVTNTYGSFTASAATLSVNDPVVIVVPPLSQAANDGDEVTLVVTATGTGPFTYQWRRNTAPLSGETGPSLTFTASALTGGNYDCVVTNVVGSVPSLTGTVTVLAPPVITLQPVNQLIAAGASALLSVTAGGDSLTYQWRRNGVNLAGKTGALLLIDNVQKANEGSYDVVVKNAYGTVISTAATLRLTSALTITSQPVDVTTSTGNTATFSVTATGPGVLTYQWSKNGVAITNAKLAALTVTVADASAAGLYTVTVTSGTLKVTSNPASLRVNDDGLLIYNLAATGATVQGVTSTSVALTGTLILDRTNQRGALIWFGKSGAINTFTTEIHEDLRAHSTGPVAKSQTVISRVVTSGSAPDEDVDLLWLRGTDGPLTIATNDKAMGPQTLAGTLNTMTLSSTMRVEALSLNATLDAAGSATARKTGETVERTLNRLAAYWQLKGYVRQ